MIVDLPAAARQEHVDTGNWERLIQDTPTPAAIYTGLDLLVAGKGLSKRGCKPAPAARSTSMPPLQVRQPLTVVPAVALSVRTREVSPELTPHTNDVSSWLTESCTPYDHDSAV